MKKLTRREAALVRHARRQAIENYERTTELKVIVNGHVLNRLTICQLRSINIAQHGINELTFFSPWP